MIEAAVSGGGQKKESQHIEAIQPKKAGVRGFNNGLDCVFCLCHPKR